MVKKRILAIGAYERDNFGDLLFYQVLDYFMSDATVVAGSIFYSDMTETLGEKVLPYPILLSKYRWDAVWVVGGEVGGVDIERAYNMSLTPDKLTQYRKLDLQKKVAVQKALGGEIVPTTAYLPDLARFELNRTTPLIINSVGVSNITQLHETSVRNKSTAALRSATYLTIRDKRSEQFCKKRKIQAELTPDVVHAIGGTTKWRKLKKQTKTPYITFQINQSLLQEYDRKKVAEFLVSLIKKTKLKIVMIAAGTAVHHDSYAEYERLKMLVGARVGQKKIEVLLSRSPATIVESIVNSKIWIGTSLHGRIVASAFHIPRVSLTNTKVANYAQTWDSEFPSNTPLNDMVEIAETLLNQKYSNEQKLRDKNITSMALKNLERIKVSYL